MRLIRAILNLPRNLVRGVQDMIRRGDIMTLLIVTTMLLMPALSLVTANWPLEPRIVIPTTLASLFFGYMLARSQYNELLALIVSATYGILITLFISAMVVSGNPVQGSVEVIVRFIEWLYDFVTGGINQDALAFTLLVAALFWFLGYNAVWHIFRIDRVLRVIIPPALILIINMIVYTGEESLDIYLGIFILMGLLLMVRSSIEQREYDWFMNGIRAPRLVRGWFLRIGAALSVIALATAWIIPTANLQERLNGFQEFLASDPFREAAEFLNRVVQPIESEGPATSDFFGGDALALGGAIRLGDQVIFLVNAPNDRRYYWRSRVFERYDDGRWSPSATLRVPDLTPPMDLIMDNEVIGINRTAVTQIFTVGTGGTRLIYTAPQPSQIVDVGGRIDLLRTQPLLDSQSPVNVSVIRPARVLERGMTYTAVSLMSDASANELRSAATTYPAWVSEPNTFPGLGVSGRVVNKAREIVTAAGATTPYDQAKAIEIWLRTNIAYNERIPEPPNGVDPIEWFMFEMKQGYCTYYATAMITMLRSLGIPARMAAGFAQGEYDASVGQFVVREKDAHTWVEVYFPGYGWIEFEPTSAQQPINREGDFAPQPPPQQGQPQATSTPTMTPTLVPSPTPFASPTQQPPDTQQQPLDPPTATPTSSPTPTATPVIVPTVAPPIKPPNPPTNDFLPFLLSALGLATLLFLLVVVLVLIGVFIYWWWEWRGMGGLSPVARAYARLERYVSLLRVRPTAQDTPEERREKIVEKIPLAERPVTAITRTYSVERYGKPTEGTAEGARNARIADNAWTAARRLILEKWLRRFINFRRRG